MGKTLSKPVQKTLGLPGEAAFVLVAGYSTGVPVSAALIARLRKENRISKKQGNRLLAFSANVSPAFILSAVAVAMVGIKAAGPFLAAVHYGTNFCMTLFCSFFLRENTNPLQGTTHKTDENIQGISIGILSDAVFQSLRTIFLIGGIIVTFFILIAVFDTTGIFTLLSSGLGFSREQASVLRTLFCGFLEITAGSGRAAALITAFPLKIAVISGILAFGGISSACQIASQIQETDLSVGFYLRYKAIQGVLAFTVSLLLPMKIQGVFAPIGFGQNPPFVLFLPLSAVLYGLTVVFATFLIIRRLYCAGQRRRLFYWCSGEFHRGSSSRCKEPYPGCFRSDKERR